MLYMYIYISYKYIMFNDVSPCIHDKDIFSLVFKMHHSNEVQNLEAFEPRESGNVQGTIGCTPNSVPMVFIVFSRDSWGL